MPEEAGRSETGAKQAALRRIKLPGGVVVPYPEPTSSAATAVGKGNRRTDTAPEVALRSALHRSGLRFRKDYRISTSGRPVRGDIVFPRQRVAVFVDGCFWHGCPDHGRTPRSNQAYWAPKLQANRDRDKRVDEDLQASGWRVLRLWEHTPVDEAVREVQVALASTPAEERPDG